MRKLSLSELSRPDVATYQAQPKQPFVLVLDDVRSMLNLGSIFRTADAFALEKLVLCGITARPPHREIHKTALGATESVAWEYHAQVGPAVAALKAAGYTPMAIEQTDQSTPLQAFRPQTGERYAFILGNEVQGVQAEALAHCAQSLEIPQFGTKHSLNVAVTAGVICWHLTQFVLPR